MKRAMTPFEKFHVDRLIGTGCRICGRPAAWHHFIHGVGGGRITTEHLFGMPLCGKHHQHGDDALHNVADENKWCENHGIDKNDYIGEVAVSLALWVSGKPRKSVTLRLV